MTENKIKKSAPNLWDASAFMLVMGLVVFLALGSRQMAIPYTPGDSIPLSLNLEYLPFYAMRTVVRMICALLCSLVFTFTYATVAAKSLRAEALMVPLLDILQSVPVLGFLSITVTGFIALFPGNLLGVEMASIFAIFTSQAWNMAFSFYQSLKVVPKELKEASQLFGLSPWQKFWKLEAPYATPNLIWNTMMSVSGGWFFVVASEAITVGKTSVTLPGIGSYVALAIQDKKLSAIGFALLTMLIVILLYDQLLFRPMVAWAEKFKVELSESENPPVSWVLTLFQRAYFLRRCVQKMTTLSHNLMERVPKLPPLTLTSRTTSHRFMKVESIIWYAFLVVSILFGFLMLVNFVIGGVDRSEIINVFMLGFITLTRVVILLLLACLLWVPLGVLIGLHPRWATRVQPLAQFLAAFPANLLFPVAIFLMVRYHLSPEIWCAPLMILGTQWYILFNVIAGASAIPNDLIEAAKNLGLSGWRLWKYLLLPAILPSLLTGLVTASGGTWNASIVAEVVSWGSTKLIATGLGSYIAQWSGKGDYPHIVLGIAVMSLYVVLFNRLFWRRLYTISQTRYRLD